MSNTDAYDYGTLPIAKTGYIPLGYNGTSEGELVSTSVAHGLAYTPLVIAFHKGSNASGPGNNQAANISMIPLPFHKMEDASGLKTKYVAWFQVTATSIIFYRLQGSRTDAGGDQTELFKYYVFAQPAASR